MRRGAATALLAGALLLSGGCKTYKMTDDPLAAAPAPPPVATTPAPPISLTSATTTVPVATAPAATVHPVTTRAVPPTVPGRRFAGASPIIAAAVAPAVVDIDGTVGAGHAFGTGMVLTTTGQVLTSSHVVRGAQTIMATVVDTGRTYHASVIGVDQTADVAVLQLQDPVGLVGIVVGASAVVAPGDPVSAIDNAGGRGGVPNVMSGAVVATGQSLDAAGPGGVEHLTNLIDVSTPSQPGDSGGPLANAFGQVIGMVVAASGGAGYAIPINTVLAVARQIQAGHAGAGG